MEDGKYDKLDKLFQSRLGGDGQRAEGWNTPPAYLLDSALDTVNEDYPKKRRRFWIWFSLGLLLLGFAGGIMYSHFTIQDLNQKISHLEDQQNEWQQERFAKVENQITSPADHQEIAELAVVPVDKKILTATQMDPFSSNQDWSSDEFVGSETMPLSTQSRDSKLVNFQKPKDISSVPQDTKETSTTALDTEATLDVENAVPV